jgi:hypothetical protein
VAVAGAEAGEDAGAHLLIVAVEVAQQAVQPFMGWGVGVCDTRDDRHGVSQASTGCRVKR